MGMSSIAPVAQVYADHRGTGDCPDIGTPGRDRVFLISFVHRDKAGDGSEDSIDRNGNGNVCDLVNASKKPTKILATIDDILVL